MWIFPPVALTGESVTGWVVAASEAAEESAGAPEEAVLFEPQPHRTEAETVRAASAIVIIFFIIPFPSEIILM